MFLLAVVGAETTMGAFLVTYVEGMAEAGRLLPSPAGAAGADAGAGAPGQAEGELLTSAFWVAFTAGRFGNGAASSRFRPACALLALLPHVSTSAERPAKKSPAHTAALGGRSPEPQCWVSAG